ncbi:MAG TPA: methyltransferase domain-containing protein [Solirubrobacteraceae bacterium]|jgi:predicted O-methyltransferase YrrM|nr:methyltransferase domain-containing protein [Solirubrobacteraceae bacterium]
MNRRDGTVADLMTFLNVGYLSDLDELSDEDTSDVADRVSELLYDQVVGAVDLAGLEVVEVGCGPGGGSAYLARAHHPASLVGVDINKKMIDWCRERHLASNLRFLQGDAQDLPIASDSVDVIVNVESSHCYPSRARFFQEVARVLRPGGSFLIADAIFGDLDKKGSDLVSAQLRSAGLRIEDCVDISENALAARDAVSRSRNFQLRTEKLPSLMMPFVEESLCLKGTRIYEMMVSRQIRYMRWRALKPAELATPSSAERS